MKWILHRTKERRLKGNKSSFAFSSLCSLQKLLCCAVLRPCSGPSEVVFDAICSTPQKARNKRRRQWTFVAVNFWYFTLEWKIKILQRPRTVAHAFALRVSSVGERKMSFVSRFNRLVEKKCRKCLHMHSNPRWMKLVLNKN